MELDDADHLKRNQTEEQNWGIESTNKIWEDGRYEIPRAEDARLIGLGLLYDYLNELMNVVYCPSERIRVRNIILSEDTSQEEDFAQAARRLDLFKFFDVDCVHEGKDVFSSYIYRGRDSGGRWIFEYVAKSALVMDYNVYWKQINPSAEGPACINHKLKTVNILYGNGTVLTVLATRKLVFTYIIDEGYAGERWINKDDVWIYADRLIKVPR